MNFCQEVSMKKVNLRLPCSHYRLLFHRENSIFGRKFLKGCRSVRGRVSNWLASSYFTPPFSTPGEGSKLRNRECSVTGPYRCSSIYQWVDGQLQDGYSCGFQLPLRYSLAYRVNDYELKASVGKALEKIGRAISDPAFLMT